MTSPLFSVVIPTRERAETLRSCLRTCLNQDFEDYEVVVCDNYSSPATREVVEAFASPRIRYLRTDRPLAMSANWEYAVSEARGEYVTVLGDDDGLMPYALRELDRLVRQHNRPRAIRWSRGIYTWPTVVVPEDANFMMLPIARSQQWRNARDTIREIIEFRLGADFLPMIYNSVIHRDLIDEHRRQVGQVFPTIHPDIYTGFGLGWLAGTLLSVEAPMNIAGLSGRSNGMATLRLPEGNPIAAEFNDLNRAFGYVIHPRVPNLPTPPIHIADSFEYAKQFFFPHDDTLSYDRQAMTERYLTTIPNPDVATRDSYRAMIRAALADRPDLQDWFDREAPNPPPIPWPRTRPAELGFDGTYLRLDTAGLGVKDIEGAVNLAAQLLGIGRDPIRYDLPTHHTMHLQQQATEQRANAAEATLTAERNRLLLEQEELKGALLRARSAEAGLAAEKNRLLLELEESKVALLQTQRDGALRNVPRRLARKMLKTFHAR